jgi:beta-galactosidase
MIKHLSLYTILLLALMSACKAPSATRQIEADTFPRSFVPPVNTDRLRLFDSDWKFFKGDISGAEVPGFDDSRWRKTDLPHDWSIEDLPDQKEGEVIGPFDKKSIGLFYTSYTIGGTGWYRKSFTVEKGDQDKDISIYFDGAYMESDVWLNGHHLGSHKHGYTAFYYRLNEFLNQPGQKNTIAVLVKNIGENSRWYSGSGIYRHVWLRMTDHVNIPVWGVFVTTPEVSVEKSKVKTSVSVSNSSAGVIELTIRNTIISPEGKEIKSAEKIERLGEGEKLMSEQLIEINDPDLWSDETPFLYTLKTELISEARVLDSEVTTFGIRSIAFSPEKGFLLNGKRVILKGACIHHDNGPLGSVALDRADQRRIEILKSNGFNAIRTSHNPPSQGFLDACDRYGMLVLDEAFDMWQRPKRPDDYHLFFNEWHEKDLRSMILRDRNHPSVILWSIGNEISERADSSGLRIAKELIGIIKSIDTTRPVTQAICEFWETKGRKWEDSAPAYALLDVCSYNYVWGEYEKDHATYPDRVIAGTESFAMDIYQNWKMATEKPYVTGDFVWTGMDYLGEAGIGQVMTDSTTMCWPWMNANCGDLDLIGYKKPQSYYRDVVWDRSKIEMAAEEIPPAGKEWMIRAWGWYREYPGWNWPGNEGKNMKVRVYTKCDGVKLELNGKLISEQKAAPDSKFTFVFSVPYEPGELKATALSEGHEVAVKSLVTTGPAESIKITPDRTVITCNRNDLAYLTVELTDSKGARVVDSEARIMFKVEGEAELVAVDNGNPRDPKSFRSDNCKAYHGRCLAILRPTGKPGKVTLSASTKESSTGMSVIEIK